MAEDAGAPTEQFYRVPVGDLHSPDGRPEPVSGPELFGAGWPPPAPFLDESVRPGRHAAPARAGSTHSAAVYRVPPPLDDAVLFNRVGAAPRRGWRRTVHTLTGGRFTPGQSARDRERADLFARIARPIEGDFRVAVLSIKGGVGKTTTTLGLGSAFARIRSDRIVAVDANPDRGTLAQRVQDPSTATVGGLLADPLIQRYSDVRAYTRMSSSRLEVLGSDPDPAVAEAFGESDYRRAVEVLQNYYSVILSDCGTGIMHSATAGVLSLADAVVVVSAPSLDSMKSAAATLKWLTLHGYSALSRESHLVISASRPGASGLQMEKVREHFAARCRSTHLIPFDPHLAEGGQFESELLKPATSRAYLELAAAVSEQFGSRRAADLPAGPVR